MYVSAAWQISIQVDKLAQNVQTRIVRALLLAGTHIVSRAAWMHQHASEPVERPRHMRYISRAPHVP